MRKILLFIPILLFGGSLMHPDDPKSRNHNSLGFGVTGDVVISDGVFYVGQTGSSLNNGSVYIYTPNGSNGFDQKNIMAPIDEELGFDFGYSIDVNGDLMLIGAPHRTDLVGRAYLYQKDYKDRWQLIEIISPSSENLTSDFGSQVKINEQHILIADQKFNQEKGSVFTMKLNLNTDRWELGNILSYEKMNQDGFFGYSMALNSDRAVIGSRNGNIAVEYQFDKTTEEWFQKQIFSPYQFQSKGRYGYAVDMNSEYLIIGSPGYDELGFTEIHQLVNDDWKKVYSISNPENIKESFFGSSVTIDNDHLIIGNYNGEKSQTIQGESTETIDFRRSFSPLLGIKLVPKNWPLIINFNFNNNLTFENTGQNDTEKKGSEQINITFDYKRDGGMQIPIFFLRDFEIENKVDLKLTLGYDKSYTDVGQGNQDNTDNQNNSISENWEWERIAYTNSYNIKPEITYSFSKYIDGNFYVNYSVSETSTTGSKETTDIGFKIKIVFESFK